MFSYLHGIRPNNRRSAIPSATAPLNATSSRYYHEIPTSPPSFNPEVPQSQHTQPRSINEVSPVSPIPPILPSIPRIASKYEVRGFGEREHPGPERVNTSPEHRKRASPDAQFAPSEEALNNKVAAAKMPANAPDRVVRDIKMPPPPLPPEPPHMSPERKKRPIDIRFESMRSYSEPPFRQSIHMPQASLEAFPGPLRQPPTPPPKPFQSQFRGQAPVQTQQSPPQDESMSRPTTARPSHSSHGRHQSEIAHPKRSAPPPPAHPSHAVASQNRHGKTKLNLLNPMSLLARRRSHQVVEEVYSQNQSAPGLRLPDDYDPRIRGKVVHDFSAPRPGRSHSSNDTNASLAEIREIRDPDYRQKRSSKTLNKSTQEDDSPSSPEREHTPVFKEHFDDGLEGDQNGPAKRLSSAFMLQMSLQESEPEPDPSSLPAFARKLPTKLSAGVVEVQKTSSPAPKAPLDVVLESPDPGQIIDHSSPPTSPPMSPPRVRSRPTSISDATNEGLGSPKRYKSNASRFSFDLAGVGSAAQEKLLEEKHRQKAKRKQRESTLSDEDQMDEDDYLHLEGMDDDGLEERIPGVNADDDEFEEETEHLPVSQQALETFNLVSPNKSSFESMISPVSTGMTSPATPRDLQGQAIGFAVSKASSNLEQIQNGAGKSPRPRSTPGIASNSSLQAPPLQREVASESNLAALPSRLAQQDDDLYFDDGMIEDLDASSAEEFDESVFDDNSNGLYGLPLRDRTLKPLPETDFQVVTDDTTQLHAFNSSTSQSTMRTEKNLVDQSHLSLSSDGVTAELRDALTDLNQPTRPPLTYTAGLTQDNLAAYNLNSMPSAAYQAAVKEAFGHCEEPPSDFESSHGMTGDNSHQSQDLAGLPAFNDYDDDAEDDPIVAAANAEALENDDDGFYGQEFGFFARASGSSDDTEYANGGYFGPRALAGVHRSHSGRANFQEPSLTPITERTEWSNRNSIALTGYPLSAVSLTGPQYADMPLDDINKQLAMLKQLRRGAWGGSNGSLRSSSNSQNSGSPLTHLPPGMVQPSPLQGSNSNLTLQTTTTTSGSAQNLTSSFHSVSSSNGRASSIDSDPSPSTDSPTITFATSTVPSTTSTQPPSSIAAPDPTALKQTRPAGKSGHSRNSSGAEVSYIEEGGVWVLEKRRVGEMGEVEILGRSVVEGGRI